MTNPVVKKHLKEITFSSFLILFTVFSVFSSTKAFFSENVFVTKNVITSGTFKIYDNSEDWMSLWVDFSGLRPGHYVRKWVVIKNEGNLDVTVLNLYLKIKNDPSDLISQLDAWIYVDDVFVGSHLDQKAPQINGQSLLSPTLPVLKSGDQTKVLVMFKVPDDLSESYQLASASLDLIFHAEQSH